jgi:hypothetical protein
MCAPILFPEVIQKLLCWFNACHEQVIPRRSGNGTPCAVNSRYRLNSIPILATNNSDANSIKVVCILSRSSWTSLGVSHLCGKQGIH